MAECEYCMAELRWRRGKARLAALKAETNSVWAGLSVWGPKVSGCDQTENRDSRSLGLLDPVMPGKGQGGKAARG